MQKRERTIRQNEAIEIETMSCKGLKVYLLDTDKYIEIRTHRSTNYWRTISSLRAA